MSELERTLEIRSSPHVLSGYSVDTIMFNVVLALLPTTIFAVISFGFAALLTLMVAVVSCVGTEHLVCRLAGRASTVGDWSAVIMGLLYGLVLPPSLPLWMVAVGGIFGVLLGKSLFGGLGANPFNPALVARAFLQAAFPAAMTTWIPGFASDRFAALPSSTLTLPFSQPQLDGLTTATPLALFKFEAQLTPVADLATGFVSGSTGETSALLILLGGAYLVVRNMMSWRIPLALFATVLVCSGALHWFNPAVYAPPGFMFFSGGLVLGAVFMATDMVSSPMSPSGCIAYGVMIGLLVVVIRVWGGMPEGVMYAILLGNATTPLIDRWLRPSVYGARESGGIA